VPADYDGDGKTDLAVYFLADGIPTPGSFSILQSSTDSKVIRQWGTNIDRRVQADYDGDGKADLAVYRGNTIFPGAENGVWYILQSSNNTLRVERFGLPTDKLVPADYDGDSKADIAVWRPSDGFWYYLNSSNQMFNAVQFGASGDKPTPADYDGDGKTDIAVFRPSTGFWYLLRSTQGFAAQQFGLKDDIPIPNVFVR
jgi:glucan-binding YG repeat protein